MEKEINFLKVPCSPHQLPAPSPSFVFWIFWETENRSPEERRKNVAIVQGSKIKKCSYKKRIMWLKDSTFCFFKIDMNACIYMYTTAELHSIHNNDRRHIVLVENIWFCHYILLYVQGSLKDPFVDPGNLQLIKPQVGFECELAGHPIKEAGSDFKTNRKR